MKKIWILFTFVTLVALFMTTVNVMASGAQPVPADKPKAHTPGAKATEKATLQGNPAQKGQPEKAKLANYKGTIELVDATSLTLKLKDGTTQVFVLNEQTMVKVPTLGKSATIADLVKGDGAMVSASKAEGGSLVATGVMVIPGKPQKIHRVGKVTDYQPNVSITIEDKNGEKFTFVVNEQTKILPPDQTEKLVPGVRVTIICPRDVAHRTLTATGIVIHPEETEEETTGTPATATMTETPTETPTNTSTPTATETSTPTATFTETPTFTATP